MCFLRSGGRRRDLACEGISKLLHRSTYWSGHVHGLCFNWNFKLLQRKQTHKKYIRLVGQDLGSAPACFATHDPVALPTAGRGRQAPIGSDPDLSGRAVGFDGIRWQQGAPLRAELRTGQTGSNAGIYL